MMSRRLRVDRGIIHQIRSQTSLLWWKRFMGRIRLSPGQIVWKEEDRHARGHMPLSSKNHLSSASEFLRRKCKFSNSNLQQYLQGMDSDAKRVAPSLRWMAWDTDQNI